MSIESCACGCLLLTLLSHTKIRVRVAVYILTDILGLYLQFLIQHQTHLQERQEWSCYHNLNWFSKEILQLLLWFWFYVVDFPIDFKMWSVISQPIRNKQGTIDKTKCCIALTFCPAIYQLTKQILIDWITFAPLWFAKTGKLLHEFHWIIVGSNWQLVYSSLVVRSVIALPGCSNSHLKIAPITV